MHVRKSLDTASLMKASKLLGDKDYVVYDDWMMEADVDRIYNTLFSLYFPWFWANTPHWRDGEMYTTDASLAEEMSHMKKKGMVPGWQLRHTFVRWNSDTQQAEDNDSPYSQMPNFILSRLSDKFNLSGLNIFRVKANLRPQVLGAVSESFDIPHIDMNEDHIAMIYYVNDSDGDTFIFNDDMHIIDRVSPKKGRVLVMNGKRRHAAGHPVKNQNRVVMNFNFLESETEHGQVSESGKNEESQGEEANV